MTATRSNAIASRTVHGATITIARSARGVFVIERTGGGLRDVALDAPHEEGARSIANMLWGDTVVAHRGASAPAQARALAASLADLFEERRWDAAIARREREQDELAHARKWGVAPIRR